MLRTVAPLGGSCPWIVTSLSPAQFSRTPPTSFPPSSILRGLRCSGRGVGTRTEEEERAVVTRQLGPVKGRFWALWLGGPRDSIFLAVARDRDGSHLTHYKRALPELWIPNWPSPPIQPQGLGCGCAGYLGWGARPRSGRAAGPRQGAANTRS